MASKAAYYEGLQYANRDVKPVDFGRLALGIAQVEKEKFDRAEKEKKEDEAFQLKLNEDFGDIVYPSFDKSGLENADIYMDGASEMISARSQDLNDQYNSGAINKVQYRREMTKLKGQAQQLTNNIGMIQKFVDDYRGMGDNIDPSSQDTMEELQALFENAKPYLTKDNRLGNISAARNEKGELEPRGFLWDKAASMLQVDAKYDTFGIPKQILGIQGDLSKFIGTEAILNTHLNKDGSLKEGTANLISESVSTLSDRQIISYARQNGYAVEKDNTDRLKLLNRAEIEKQIIKDQQEKTLALLQQKGSSDEIAYAELDLKTKALSLSYEKERRLKGEKAKSTTFSYTPEMAKQYTSIFGQEGAGFVEHVMKDDKDKFVSALPNFIEILAPTLSGPLTNDEDKSTFSTIKGGIIQSLWEHPNGQHGVVVTVPSEIPEKYLEDDREKIKWKGVGNTYFFPIQSNTEANILRAKFDLGDMNPEQKKYWTPSAQASQTLATGILD